MTDLTTEEQAAQEGAYDPPDVQQPILAAHELNMSAGEFVAFLAELKPKVAQGYGTQAGEYAKQIHEWVDYRATLESTGGSPT